MNVIDWVQLLLGIGFVIVGLIMFIVEIVGVYKFKYILNRMHAAAMGDTLGLACTLVGLMILSGFNFTSVKLAMVVVFLWLASPVSSHLIAQLEVTTNEHLEEVCEIEIQKEESENGSI